MSAPGSAPRVPAPIDLGDDVVVFDYGEVISRSPSDDDRARLLERAGVDRSDAAAVAAALHRRDASDSTVVDFLTAAPGVEVVDSTHLDFDQTVDAVIGVIRTNVPAQTGAHDVI